MDTKNTLYSDGYKEFYDLLKYKLDSRDPYDAIIVADDAALNFTMQYRQELFPGIPIVFDAIDNIKNAQTAALDPLITGIEERVDYQKSIDAAKAIQSQAKNLVFIVDNSENGLGIQEQLKQCTGCFEGYHIRYIASQNYTEKQLCDMLRGLDEDDIVFCESMGKGHHNKIYTVEERNEILKENIHKPVYRVTPSGIGDGFFLGGYVIKHEECGRIAGRMVREILSGKKPSQISVVTDAPSEYCYDYTVMQKYGIIKSQIPAGAKLINLDPGFLEQYDD